MGKTQTVDALVEGGKASAGPPLGPTLGALKLNVGQVVSEINKKTADFKGMQVPVKLVIDLEDKSFTITVGTPPVSALLKKEAGIEKGSGNPLADKVANIYIEQVIKVSKMKEDVLLGKTPFARVNEVLGTCNSMGVMVEGKQAKDIIVDIRNGAFKQEITSQKTELTDEEMKSIEEEKKRLQQDIEKRKAEFTSIAQKIIAEMAGKPRGTIKARLVELKVPSGIIEELLPVEAAAATPGGAAGAKAPAEGKK